jgi:signal transduction histidine kinase
MFRGSFGLRLALWYAGIFAGSSIVLVALTYALLATSLRQRDHEIIISTLREYASRYEAGGLPALARAVELEERAGRHERLFVRVIGRGRDALFLSMPPEWSDFDVDRLENSDTWGRAPAPGREATLEVAPARLFDGTILQVGKSTESRDALLASFRRVVLIASIAMMVVALVGGAVVTRSTVQPIRDLAAVVRRIILTGRTDARVPDAGTGDALDELSALFNTMLTRITALIDAMRDSLDNVAHDLRTPMARLRGLAERGLASGDPEVQREALADCVEECDRMLSMLNTLMDISEAETGTLRLTLTEVPLQRVIGEVIEVYEDTAEQKGVSLSMDDGPDVVVSADRDRLRQAIANLVDNAVKYTAPGGSVRIAAKADGPDAVITVTDSGMGISPEEQLRIWDRLYRGDHSRTERGLGLGLSLVRAYVRAHGGDVDVSSTPGQGSTFTIRLPASAGLQAPGFGLQKSSSPQAG